MKMAKCWFVCAVLSATLALVASVPGAEDLFSTPIVDANGRRLTLEEYRGRVLLIVNVASECGFTDGHYKSLVKLQMMFSRLQVLAFPCNQFGAQEPQDAASVQRWAKATYDVNFPIFGKVNVTGENASPLFRFLISATAKEPTWNFWKYLVNHEGRVLHAWGPWQDVEVVFPEIKAAVDAIPIDEAGSRRPRPPAPARVAEPRASLNGDTRVPAGPPEIKPPSEKPTGPKIGAPSRMKHDDL
ncbi:hypothetical protein CAPTEDRAFT_172308 [Capitella teleta]|uniref:Glutathione peroxidase n=1 Tax=Capitella teleta TaxID=283909 RepID=R7UKA5_CAPTE|nr:hypothetical protein CAPTEDRAFT_172308 [Capitella teleta]|eukprot:ELU03712.1 hypothetical protein CAPTEDRAFT_172308 [Capitella teleta]